MVGMRRPLREKLPASSVRDGEVGKGDLCSLFPRSPSRLLFAFGVVLELSSVPLLLDCPQDLWRMLLPPRAHLRS